MGFKKNTSFEVRPDKHTPEEILLLIPEEGVIIYDRFLKVTKMWNGSMWETLSSNSTTVSQKSANYASLTAGTIVGQIAYVNASSGTPWLPYSYGGTYYPAGWYLWNGTIWVSDRNNVSEQLQLNVEGLGSKVDKVAGDRLISASEIAQLESKLFNISINFQEVEPFNYTPRVAFKINSITNPDSLTVTITVNGNPYSLGVSIAQYASVVVVVSGIGFINLNSEEI